MTLNEIYSSCGETFDINNDSQLLSILKDKLDLINSLADLETSKHPLIKGINEMRI